MAKKIRYSQIENGDLIGSVKSVGFSVPTGFSVSNSPITTSGTITLTFASGYSLPTTIKQTNWDSAYNSIGLPLTNLTTNNKTSLVSAINEINANVGTQYISNQNIDLTDATYERGKWYAVVSSSPMNGRNVTKIRINTSLGNSGVPTWATHSSGFMAELELETLGGEWGGTNMWTRVLRDNTLFTTSQLDTQKPIGYAQEYQTSKIIIWLRGGGKYDIRTTIATTFAIYTSGTLNSISLTPRINRPLEFVTNISNFGLKNDNIGTYSYGSAEDWQHIKLKSLGNNSVTLSTPGNHIQLLRNENGAGGVWLYSPVLHLGGGDTWGQLQIDYYRNRARVRGGINGSAQSWVDLITSNVLGDNLYWDGNRLHAVSSGSGGGDTKTIELTTVNLTDDQLNNGFTHKLSPNEAESEAYDQTGLVFFAVRTSNGNWTSPANYAREFYGKFGVRFSEMSTYTTQGTISYSGGYSSELAYYWDERMYYLVAYYDISSDEYYHGWADWNQVIDFRKNSVSGGGMLCIIGKLIRDDDNKHSIDVDPKYF